MSTGTPPSPRAVWSLMSRAGRLAAVLAILAALVFATSLWQLAGAVLGPKPEPLQETEPRQHAEQQKKNFEQYLARIGGRSLFVLPLPPREPEPEPEDDGPAKPPPPPSTYGGPTIVAMLSDMVWFTGGKRLSVGEKSDDLEVIALNPPWDATLKWKDVEFKVNLFDRNKLAKAPDGKPAEAISPEAQAAPDRPPPPPKPAEPPAPSPSEAEGGSPGTQPAVPPPAQPEPAPPEPAPEAPPPTDPSNPGETPRTNPSPVIQMALR